MDKLYRYFLVFSASLIGGLVVYAATRGLVLPLGENAAAVWSWTCILAIGYLAHRLMPKNDLSRVSRIIAAILASTATAILTTYVFAFYLGILPDDSLFNFLLMIGIAAILFAVLVFLPLHYLIGKERLINTTLFVLLGFLIPAVLLFVVRPFGDDSFYWLAWQAAPLGIVGAAAALVFRLIAISNKFA